MHGFIPQHEQLHAEAKNDVRKANPRGRSIDRHGRPGDALMIFQVLFAIGVLPLASGTVSKIHFRRGIAVDATGRTNMPWLLMDIELPSFPFSSASSILQPIHKTWTEKNKIVAH